MTILKGSKSSSLTWCRQWPRTRLVVAAFACLGIIPADGFLEPLVPWSKEVSKWI